MYPAQGFSGTYVGTVLVMALNLEQHYRGVLFFWLYVSCGEIHDIGLLVGGVVTCQGERRRGCGQWLSTTVCLHLRTSANDGMQSVPVVQYLDCSHSAFFVCRKSLEAPTIGREIILHSVGTWRNKACQNVLDMELFVHLRVFLIPSGPPPPRRE